MLVSPILNLNIQPPYTLPQGSVKRFDAKTDTVCFSGGTQVFNKIRFRTAEKLYDTDFALKGENWGKKCLSTFVLDNKKGKPVELFIRACKGADGTERYEFWMPESKYCQKLVGGCWLYFYPEQQIVMPWCISSYDKNLQGVRFRCFQLAFERMLGNKYKNIIFVPDSFTYKYSLGVGFDVIDKNKIALPQEFYEKSETIDESLKDLEKCLSTKLQTYEQDISVPEDCLLFLPSAAQKDWEKIIKKTPILIDGMVPEAV